MSFADTLEILLNRIAAEVSEDTGGETPPEDCHEEAERRINQMSHMELLTWLAACDPADDPT